MINKCDKKCFILRYFSDPPSPSRVRPSRYIKPPRNRISAEIDKIEDRLDSATLTVASALVGLPEMLK